MRRILLLRLRVARAVPAAQTGHLLRTMEVMALLAEKHRLEAIFLLTVATVAKVLPKMELAEMAAQAAQAAEVAKLAQAALALHMEAEAALGLRLHLRAALVVHIVAVAEPTLPVVMALVVHMEELEELIA